MPCPKARDQKRVAAGVSGGGRFAIDPRPEAELELTGAAADAAGGPVHCSNCGQFRARATAHRCLAPKLVPLSSAAQLVLEACRAAGGRPIVVGGSVRDALLAAHSGRVVHPKDIDIEVYGANVGRLVLALDRVGTVNEVGVSFGVLTVRCGEEDFDVSLPRVDSKVGSGHRGFDVRVDHGLDEVDAFGRRDFTVNAMAWDPTTGELVDPYAGLADLEAAVLRHTTDAFDEDPLRVLRAVQFAGRFGFEIAPETTERCRALAPAFAELPSDRVWGEWSKIATKARWPSKSMQALHDTGWERHFPELVAVRDVPQDPTWHPEGPVHVHLGLAADAAAAAADSHGLDAEQRTIAVLGAMLHDLGKATTTLPADPSLAPTLGTRITSRGHAEAGEEPVRSFLKRVGAPERYAAMIVPIVREHMCVAGNAKPSAPAVRRLARRLAGPGGHGPTLTQWAAVVAADHAGRGSASHASPADAWLALATDLNEVDKPRPGLLTGAHLIAAGMRPGPEFKPVLAAALEAQDNGEFDDEQGAAAWFREHHRPTTS